MYSIMSLATTSQKTYATKLADPDHTDFYDIRDKTRFGPASVPGYAMVPRKVTPRHWDYTPNPGPGEYYPENYGALGSRTPAFSLGGRLNAPSNWKAALPAPNTYQADICVTSECIDKSKAKSFGIRWSERRDNVTSGVPFYSLTNLDAYKTRLPTYKMAPPVGRLPPDYISHAPTPGPADYLPRVARDTPAFSFGAKYSGNVSTLRTPCEYELI